MWPLVCRYWFVDSGGRLTVKVIEHRVRELSREFGGCRGTDVDGVRQHPSTAAVSCIGHTIHFVHHPDPPGRVHWVYWELHRHGRAEGRLLTVCYKHWDELYPPPLGRKMCISCLYSVLQSLKYGAQLISHSHPRDEGRQLIIDRSCCLPRQHRSGSPELRMPSLPCTGTLALFRRPHTPWGENLLGHPRTG